MANNRSSNAKIDYRGLKTTTCYMYENTNKNGTTYYVGYFTIGNKKYELHTFARTGVVKDRRGEEKVVMGVDVTEMGTGTNNRMKF